MSQKTQNLSGMIWDTADILRGLYRESEYGEVILPFTVLRRLDSIIEDKQDLMLEKYEEFKDYGEGTVIDAIELDFYNISKFNFQKLIKNPDDIRENLESYIESFSSNVLDIFEHFELEKHIKKLHQNNLLYEVVKRFAQVDLSLESVSQIEMGYVFEELLRKFADMSGETAGEHFTPQEVIELMIDVLLVKDVDILTQANVIRKIYDPTCGTGNMLSPLKGIINNFVTSEDWRQMAKVNDIDNFKIKMESSFKKQLVRNHKSNENLFNLIMKNTEMQSHIQNMIMKEIYSMVDNQI